MSIWDTYPPTYRSAEVQAITAAVCAGECVQVAGLSGAGKSNLLGFIAHRLQGERLPDFLLLDLNRLPRPEAGAFQELLAQGLGGEAGRGEELLARRLEQAPDGLSLLIDRFDALPPEQALSLAGNLRALRDAFKYALTYVIGVRRPLDAGLELAELFFGNTLTLGALAPGDARWSAQQYARRRRLDWSEQEIAELVSLSNGYPCLLRAACEAYTGGSALEAQSLAAHPAVRLRLAEILRDAPSPADLQQAGLATCPLFLAQRPPVEGAIEAGALTAREQRLYDFLRRGAGQVCEKNDIIQAVWPEDVVADGLRDESLAQLVRRLRRKIEPDPERPARLLTVPGRGYRLVG